MKRLASRLTWWPPTRPHCVKRASTCGDAFAGEGLLVRALSRSIPSFFRLLQPVRHPHPAVQRRRDGEMILRLLTVARAPIELAEAEMAMGGEGAHAELAGERQRLAVGAFGHFVVLTGCRRDVTGEAECVGLAGPSLHLARERECL